MPVNARERMLGRLDAYAHATADPAVSVAPGGPTQHNSVAALFRNGLSVIAFAILESFLRERYAELVLSIDRSAIAFSSLPAKFQEHAIAHALDAIRFRAKLEPKQDRLTFLTNNIAPIASTLSQSYDVSPYGFFYGSPNVSAEEVGDFLLALNVETPWDQVRSIATRVGFGGLTAYKEVFTNIARRRHAAAHDIQTNVTQGDLTGAHSDILAIAIGVDLLATKAIQLVNDGNDDFLLGKRKLTASDIKLRFVRHRQNGDWSEIRENGKRALRNHNDQFDLVFEASERAKRMGEFLIQTNQASMPIVWAGGE